MGRSSSLDVPRAKFNWVWLDFEGGLPRRGKCLPVWDVSFICEFTKAAGTRYCAYYNKRQRAMLRKSLPESVFKQMRVGVPWKVEYRGADFVRAEKVVDCDTVETCAATFLRALPQPATLAAWNMNGSDRKVIERLCPSLDAHMCDPLKFFRRNIGLPSNSLASCRPGTPRHALKLHDMFAAAGPAHTSMADTLYLREATNVAVSLMHMSQVKESPLTFDWLPVPRAPLYLIEDFLVQDGSKFEPKPPPPLVLADHFFDNSGNVFTKHSAALKRQLTKLMEAHAKIPKSRRQALNASKKKSTMTKIVLEHLQSINDV